MSFSIANHDENNSMNDSAQEESSSSSDSRNGVTEADTDYVGTHHKIKEDSKITETEKRDKASLMKNVVGQALLTDIKEDPNKSELKKLAKYNNLYDRLRKKKDELTLLFEQRKYLATYQKAQKEHKLHVNDKVLKFLEDGKLMEFDEKTNQIQAHLEKVQNEQSIDKDLLSSLIQLKSDLFEVQNQFETYVKEQIKDEENLKRHSLLDDKNFLQTMRKKYNESQMILYKLNIQNSVTPESTLNVVKVILDGASKDLSTRNSELDTIST